MSDNSQDNGQHPVIDDETSVQPEDEPTTEAQSEQTSQSQVQEAAQEPHLMANHQPTQQQSSSAIEPQQSTNLVESGVPFSQTFGAVDRASLMEMTPSQMAVTFPLNPSGEQPAWYRQSLEQAFRAAIAQSEAAGNENAARQSFTVRIVARFNASGTPTVMPPVVTRDSEWDQPAEPEWDLYPHDITEAPSAAWPVDERDPFQNPAIARGLYRSFSPEAPPRPAP